MITLLIICISALGFIVSMIFVGDSYSPAQYMLSESEQYDALAESYSRRQWFWTWMGLISFVVFISTLTYSLAMFVKDLL